MGIGFGVLTLAAAIFNMKSLSIGPMAYTTIITTASMMIPALSGRIFRDEPVHWYQYLGMAVMLISMICAINTDTGERKASLRWLALCLLTFVCMGCISVTQKIHQSSGHGEKSTLFLVAAFTTSAVLSGAMDSAVFFPIVNGGGTLLAALAGIVFFGEKFTRKQWLGIVLGMTAVLMLCL